MAVELVEVVVVVVLVQQVSMELELEPVLSRLVSLFLCSRCPLELALDQEAQEEQQVGHPLVWPV